MPSTPRDPAPLVDARSDEVLARRAGLGDREAFTAIYHRHGAALFRYAVRLLDGDSQAAEDAVHKPAPVPGSRSVAFAANRPSGAGCFG